MRARPRPRHSQKYHGIYAILWKCMIRFLILHIFAYVLRLFTYLFILELPKWPYFNYIKLTINNSLVLWTLNSALCLFDGLFKASWKTLYQNFQFEPPIVIKIGRRVATKMFFSNDHHGSSETIIGFNTKTSSR